MSQLIPPCIGFALTRSVMGPENTYHPLNQSDTNLKPVATLLAFSRASDRSHVFDLNFHWLLTLSNYLDCSGIVSRQLIEMCSGADYLGAV